MTGCYVDSEQQNFTLYSSDEKVVCTLTSESWEERINWTLALQEAIEAANKEKGIEKYGWVVEKSKKRWMVLSTRKLFLFAKAQEISMITSEHALETLSLSNCSVTSQGDVNFILTHKQYNEKTESQEVSTYVFSAKDEDECKDWVQALVNTLAQNQSDENYKGIPFAIHTVHLSDKLLVPMNLRGMYLDISSDTHSTITSLPENSELYQSTLGMQPGEMITSVDTKVQHEGQVLIVKLNDAQVKSDSFQYKFSSGNVQSSNLVTIHIESTDASLFTLSEEAESPNSAEKKQIDIRENRFSKVNMSRARRKLEDGEAPAYTPSVGIPLPAGLPPPPSNPSTLHPSKNSWHSAQASLEDSMQRPLSGMPRTAPAKKTPAKKPLPKKPSTSSSDSVKRDAEADSKTLVRQNSPANFKDMRMLAQTAGFPSIKGDLGSLKGYQSLSVREKQEKNSLFNLFPSKEDTASTIDSPKNIE